MTSIKGWPATELEVEYQKWVDGLDEILKRFEESICEPILNRMLELANEQTLCPDLPQSK